jgi:Tfp pilus assembly protein PilZ/predicted  nucleic acid-binding Zn-ribbon protein
MEPNRRQHERVRAPRIQVRVASLDRLRALYLEDLSQGGIFIRTEKALTLGAAVEVELVPPDSSALSMSGKVVRIVSDETAKREKRAGMAIKFEGLSQATEAALAALVARLREPAQERPPAPVRAPSPPPEALHEAQQRISALEMDVADLKGNIEAYEMQQRQLEEDEQTARRLAERLAQEKSEAVARAERATAKANEEVQRLRKEAAAASEARELDRRRIDELEANRARLEELEEEMQELRESVGANEAALDAERREHENTMAELDALRDRGSSARDALDSARGELVKAKADLEAERARVSSLERALAGERAKTEQARAREREVRRLLSLVSDKGEAEAPAPDEPLSPKTEADDEEEEVVGEISEEPPARDEVQDDAEEDPFDVPLEENAVQQPAAQQKPEAIGAGLDVDFDIAFQEPAALEDDDLPRPLDLAGFADKLRKAAKIVRTERYSAHTPTDPTEILVFDLLTRVETLDDLEKWTQGRVTTEKLVQICHDFHIRSLIQLG